MAFLILLALSTTLIMLLLSEVFVRLFGIGPVFHVVLYDVFQLSENPILEYELKPGAPDGDFTINQAGFRDRDFSMQKPEGIHRIAVIGDSVTYGFDCPQDETYPKFLESLLNQYARSRGPSFEALNFGVTGYNITEIVERLRVLGMKYQPDLIIYGYVLNDPQKFSWEGETLKDLQAEAEERFRVGLGRSALRTLSHSRLFLLAWHALSDEGPSPEPRQWGQVDPLVQAIAGGDRAGQYFRTLHNAQESRGRLRKGLSDLAEQAREAGQPALLAIFPAILDDIPGEYPLEDVHDLVAEEAKRQGLHVTDLQKVFEYAREGFGERILKDPYHMNTLGNRVTAAALLWWLARSDVLPEGAVDVHRLTTSAGIDPETAKLIRIVGEAVP